jgi:uncharacterized protein YbjT (DUF2867 family)
MPTLTKIAVAGATGRVGRYVVEALQAGGHEVVPIARSLGVDVITGDGLLDGLTGVACVVDAATGQSPDLTEATEFFTTAAQNLHHVGQQAGVQRMIAVSAIGIDKFSGGYAAAKVAHEQAMLSGPIPTRILRAAQFYELIPQGLEWGRQGDVFYVSKMRSQPVAARAVGHLLADLATDPAWAAAPSSDTPTLEIAGPQEEDSVELAKRFVARRGDKARIEGVSDPNDPDGVLNQTGALLPGPDAILAGPTFEEWLDSPDYETSLRTTYGPAERGPGS